MIKSGKYYPLTWDGDGEPAAHYVTGHVSEEEFCAEIARWFGGRVTVPLGAEIERVYIRFVRGPNDDWGNPTTEVRHCAPVRGAKAMT